MKTKIIFPAVIFFIILYAGIFAQTVAPKMVFNTTVHDFGKIKETGGKVEYSFIFVNMGSEPLVINDVGSTCGCTVPVWTKQPVAPGEKGFVKAVFDPIHRPGKFHKTITVKSNAENSPVTLQINGEVIPKPSPLAEEYRYQMGPVRLKKRNLHFSEIYNTEKKTGTIEIINTSDQPVKITFNKNRIMPKYLKVSCSPETLNPNQKGVISITYDAAQKNDWGYVYDRLYLSFNDQTDYKNRINISAVIKEHFTPEQIANPPVFTLLSDKTYNFGTIKQGDVIEHIFKFKNTGKSDLIIRKIKSSCGCTAATVGSKTIKPGEESSIKAVFNSRGKRGVQHKSITITTNIPEVEGQPGKSQVILMMTGKVEVPEKQENANKNKPKQEIHK
ncbi:MAG: DUF1573 domain-containing protein [Chlorobi bacterium]|nr:DUF1573 domain-containing protein [Chlorobiota bacterium]